MKTWNGLSTGIGLALLYASAYFFPRVGTQFGYWLPAVGREILYPSAVAVLCLVPATMWFSHKYATGARAHLVSVFVMVCLCWIAFLGIFTAAGYSLLDLAEAWTDRAAVVAARWIRIGIVVLTVGALVFIVLRTRKSWGKVLNLLAVLGYLFTALAVLRVAHYAHGAFGIPGNRYPGAGQQDAMSAGPASIPQRQVVWIIMDELDYDQTLGRLPGIARSDPPMPNLERLAQEGVSAENAFSPARDTIASIPILLTGFAPSALKFDSRGLTLTARESGALPFDESDSVFARLPAGPQSAAILGFYHPYCSVFPSVTPCVELLKDNVGRWFDALTVFSQPIVASSRWLPGSSVWLPNFLYDAFEPMYRASEVSLQLYPAFLQLQNKALVYIHINLPHTPGDYSQRLFGSRHAGDDRAAYRRNLRLVDQLIGQATSILAARARSQDILLIVSSDHWFRINSSQTPLRIPWIAWHVNETKGESIAERISTINTGRLIQSFLAGEIDNQSQIAKWWQDQPNYPTLMPHGYSYE